MKYDELSSWEYDSLLKIYALCQSKISKSNFTGNATAAFSVFMVAISIGMNIIVSLSTVFLSRASLNELQQADTSEWVLTFTYIFALSLLPFLILAIHICRKIYEYKFKKIVYICEAHLRRHEKANNL